MSAKPKLIRDESAWKALSQYLFIRLTQLEDMDDNIGDSDGGWNDATLEARHSALVEVLDRMSKIEEGEV